MANNNDHELRPPFEVEFPESGRKMPEHMERAVEMGTHVLVDFGGGYISKEDIARLFDEEVPGQRRLSATEEEDLEAEQRAKIRGGHPNDHSWRFK